LITVYITPSESIYALKCQSTPIHFLSRGKIDGGLSLFQYESLSWPGFVEFDDINGKVLTFSASEKVYRVWDLKNYLLLYSIQDENIQEIKISPGIMLIIYHHSQTSVPLQIVSIETGEKLTSFEYSLSQDKKIDFIEQFNEKLLIKQQGENLRILDMVSFSTIEVSQTDFVTPSAFIFLYEIQLFLTFHNRNISVWNVRGELVTKFEDHKLMGTDCNCIYITTQQDLIISYCVSSLGCGSINVSEISTGKCEEKIYGNQLQGVTALFYNEERNEIYVGTDSGFLQIWSN